MGSNRLIVKENACSVSRLSALPSKSKKLSRTHHGRATANKEIILL